MGIRALTLPPQRWLADQAWRLTGSLCTTGLLLGAVFFAASLTPSLLPRTYGTQGVVSGLSLAAGYGIGVAGRWLWSYLELPAPSARAHRLSVLVAAGVCAVTVMGFLWRATEWQNSVRQLMDMDPVDSAHPLLVGAIAALVFFLALSVGRLFGLTARFISTRLLRLIPRRVANAVGLLLAFVVFWSVIDGLLLRSAMTMVDQSFRELDALIRPDLVSPADPLSTGSEQSYVDWDDLGRHGRGFVSSRPTAGAMGRLTGEARRPIRVYVGLNADDTIEARVRRALREMIRVGAFERSVLVLITPTGTGWVDPGAIASVEYLHRGDVASVAVQYSYLQSWMSLLVDPAYGRETAETLFAAVYSYWTALPAARRPRLYLHGMSLGALHSQQSADLYDVIGDPISGALWSGTPFRSSRWQDVTAQRAPGSPAWLPVFRDSSVVRFANQFGGLNIPGASWGPMRLVYLQYASDPVTFFDPRSAYRRPAWLRRPRGPDVSPDLRWFPVVTMLQLMIDMVAASSSPPGYGHSYAPEDYLDAWRAVSAPQGWTDADLERLKRHLQR